MVCENLDVRKLLKKLKFRKVILDQDSKFWTSDVCIFSDNIIFSPNRPEFSIYNLNMLHVIVIVFCIKLVLMCKTKNV